MTKYNFIIPFRAVFCFLIWESDTGFAQKEVADQSIVRWAKGTYLYGKMESDIIRGQEDWILTVHPDGTRTVQAFVDLHDAGHQTNVILHVQKNLRPLDAYVSFWRSGVYGGAGRFLVDGTTLRASVSGPRGDVTHTIEVPEKFSLRLHPVITEGWQVWSYDRSKNGFQRGVLYNVVTIGNPSVAGIGVLREHDINYIGRENVEVPAGTFVTEHYTFNDGSYDIWLWSQDRILIRYTNFGNGNEYRLTTLVSGP